MAKVQKTVITALGEQMLFSSALTYTNATLCSQDISNLTTDQLRSLTDLTGKVLSSPISAHKRQGNTKADQVDVQVTFTNQDQKADINYSSIGWFARDHQGQETLIAVTPFIGTDTIAAAPPDGAATSSKNITLSMAAGTATEINVLIDPAGSVTPSTFNAEVDKINEALALKADNAELADYAKKADVNSALDAKADKTALDPLAKSEDVAKDVETLNSAINLKADKTDLVSLAKTADVNTELDKKADKTSLDDYAKSSDVAADVKQLSDSIATKADAKDVTDALALKDDTVDVDKKISNITNSVNSLSSTVTSNKSATDTALGTKANANDVANSFEEVRNRVKKLEGQQELTAPDFNTLTSTGIYMIEKPTNGKNSPSNGNWGTLVVSRGTTGSDSRILQEYYPDSGDLPYFRMSAPGGVWRNWKQLSDRSEINSLRDAVNTKADKTALDAYAKSADVAWKSDISSLTQALTELQAAFDAQQTKIAALQATVNNQANQLTYFKQHYIEGKAFDADQIKQAMAWTGDDGQKLAIIRDKENEGGK